jgi:dolichol-phosphate mannosyltransferase
VRALVVIPTYNEAESVVEVIDRVLAAEPRADVLVVDDGSPDGTAKLVLERGEGGPRVHLMERSGKQGLGAAYRAGFGWGLERGMTRWWRWMLICRIRRSVCRRCWTGLPMPIW